MILPREAPSTPPRFFHGDAPTAISGVIQANLEIESLGLDEKDDSQTPLDPYRLMHKVRGNDEDEVREYMEARARRESGGRYEENARDYMEKMLHRVTSPTFASAQDIQDWIEREGQLYVSRETAQLAAGELLAQHEYRQSRNDQTLEIMRNDQTEIDAETAEEIMQVRAGVASLRTALRLLARFPQLGNLELMKFSRPFDPRAIELSRARFLSSLMRLTEPDMIVGVDSIASYYRRIEVEEERIVVLKTHVARVAIRDSPELAVVIREAGVILDPKHDDLATTYRIATRPDGSKIHVAPIGIGGYGRLAPRQETA